MGHRNAPARARRARRVGAVRWRLVVVFVLAGVLTVQFQVLAFVAAVFDATNFVQNTLTAVNTANQIQLMLKDLKSLANIGVALRVARDLNVLLGKVSTIAGRMKSRQSLWSTPHTIRTWAELASFRSSSGQLCGRVITDALGVIGYLEEGTRLLNTLTTLVDSLGELSGSVAGFQSVSAKLGTLSGQMALLTTFQASDTEASLCEGWAKQIRKEALERLVQKASEDYGVIRER